MAKSCERKSAPINPKIPPLRSDGANDRSPRSRSKAPTPRTDFVSRRLASRADLLPRLCVFFPRRGKPSSIQMCRQTRLLKSLHYRGLCATEFPGSTTSGLLRIIRNATAIGRHSISPPASPPMKLAFALPAGRVRFRSRAPPPASHAVAPGLESVATLSRNAFGVLAG